MFIDNQKYIEQFKKLYKEKNKKDITDAKALEHFEKLKPYIEKILGSDYKTIHTSQYNNARQRFRQYLNNINETEHKIEKLPEPHEYIHGLFDSSTGKWAGYCHARIPGIGEHRLLYLLNKERKELIYFDIVHHDDLPGGS